MEEDLVDTLEITSITFSDGRIAEVVLRNTSKTRQSRNSFDSSQSKQDWECGFGKIQGCINSKFTGKMDFSTPLIIRAPQGGIALFLTEGATACSKRYCVLIQRDFGTGVMPGCVDIAAGAGIVFPGEDRGLLAFKDVMLKEFFEEYLLQTDDKVLLQPNIVGADSNILKYMHQVQQQVAERVGLKYSSIRTIPAKFLDLSCSSVVTLDGNAGTLPPSTDNLKATIVFETGSLEAVGAIEVDISSTSMPNICDGEYYERNGKFISINRPIYLLDLVDSTVKIVTHPNIPPMTIDKFVAYLWKNLRIAIDKGEDPYQDQGSKSIEKPKLQNIRGLPKYRIATTKVEALIDCFPYGDRYPICTDELKKLLEKKSPTDLSQVDI